MKRAGVVIAVSIAVAAAGEARAQDFEAKMAIVKPGGGVLAADGISVVPLQVVLQKRGKTNIRNAKITASAGKVSNVRVIEGERVAFNYALPKKTTTIQETFEVTLSLDEGERSETFPLTIPAQSEPMLDLLVEPAVLDLEARRDKKKISVAATASGKDIEGVSVAASPGILGDINEQLIESSLRSFVSIDPSNLAEDAPAYVLVLAATASERGFNAQVAGVATDAATRISVEIPPKSTLVIEGAINNPEPVVAPADGRTVVENVIVRYGASVRAYTKKGNKKTEISTAVPSTAAPAVFAVIPGQNYADGGTGPTLVVAAPPSPFGGDPLWPEVSVEGARLVQTIKIAPNLRALVLDRPAEPTSGAVLFDEEVAGRFELLPRRGESMTLASSFAKSGERGSVEVVVKDASGEATDTPKPRLRLKTGRALALERQSTGKYRASLPLDVPGKVGEVVEVLADLDTPPIVSGEALDPVGGSVKIALAGTAGPVKVANAGGGGGSAGSKVEPKDETSVVTPIEPKKSDGDAIEVGLTLSALVGTTFNSLFVVGASLNAELRPPVLDHRLAIRAGILFAHASGSGTAEGFGGAPPETRATIAGFLFPFDVGFAVVKEGDFELLVRAGGALRIESGAVEVASSSAGGGQRVGFGGHVSLEAAFGVGGGALVLGGTLDGIGASADGLSSDRATIKGAVTTVRADAGYRLWF